MGASAASFEVRSERVQTVAATIGRALLEVESPAMCLVFCAGKLAGELARLAELLAPRQRCPIIFASGPGVLTERRELEGETAATGLVWADRGVELQLGRSEGAPTEADLRELLGPGTPQRPTLLLLRSEGFDPEHLWRLRASTPNPRVFGAGTYGSPGLVAAVDGKVRPVSALALRFTQGRPPLIQTAHSCRLLSEPLPITRSRGSMVDEINGEPALAVLERLGALAGETSERGRQARPLLFTVLSPPRAGDDVALASELAGRDAENRDLLVRGIQGVDPGRRSLLISAEAQPGMLITFAVKDGLAARDEMSRICRQAGRNLAGAAPRFALYFNCSGRGKSLHLGPNVDTRILREQFAGLSVAGFQSAFEIGPFDGAPALQLYTGMLAIFASSS
ncbi:MAG TPA: FIST C-terminal domain-containing protein [Polyangiaceae bacterium]|jgi:small ligand-binding sensory domain FIST|nr:FIST C-terminal domain-containing protein [Polyangiaceae bacterium]